MKHVVVTRGAYRDRILLMEDSAASAAIADGWGLDPEEEAIKAAEKAAAEPGEEEPIQTIEESVEGLNEPFPESLINFEANINAGKISLDEGLSEPPVPPDEGGGSEGGGGTNPDPVPVLNSLNPSTAVLGDPDFTLHCIGSGFTASSVIRFAGQDEPTVFVSATEVTTVVKPSLGWGADTPLPVLVKSGDGQESAALDFTFTAAP